MDKKNSGVGVLDKAVTILGTLESGPHSLAELVAATGIARPTAHRLAVALEHHRLVARDLQGRFVLGPRSSELAAAAGEEPEGQAAVDPRDGGQQRALPGHGQGLPGAAEGRQGGAGHPGASRRFRKPPFCPGFSARPSHFAWNHTDVVFFATRSQESRGSTIDTRFHAAQFPSDFLERSQ